MGYRELMTQFSMVLGQIDSTYEMVAHQYGFTFNELIILYTIGENKQINQKKLVKFCFAKNHNS